MKTVKIALCLLLACSSFSVPVFAQDEVLETNRDENGKIIRGPYQTNGFWDNWFIGVGGGANALYGDGINPRYTPVVTGELGKWFAPAVGLRVGYQGWKFKEFYKENTFSHSPLHHDEDGNIVENYNYYHIDLLLDVSNAIWGYKDKRVYHFIPYIHTGFSHMTNPENPKEWRDNEFVAGPGILNTFHVSERVSIALDIRDMIFSSRFHNYNNGGPVHLASATLGVQIGLGKQRWHRFSQDLVAANKALANAYNEIDALKRAPKEKEIVEVIKEVEVPAKGDVEYVAYPLGIAPITLFFEINETVLNVTERAHLDYYVRNVLAKDPNRVLYLTGTADEGTGTQSINERLSLGRVKEVIRILKEEYNIPADRLVLKAAEIVNVNKDPRLDRSVIIEH